MSLRLYMDHHVIRAVTAALRERGIDVLTAGEDGRARLSDEALLERATELGRLVFTSDVDFLAIAPRWQRERRRFAGVLFAHALDASLGRLIDDLQLIAEAGRPDEFENRVCFLPLR